MEQSLTVSVVAQVIKTVATLGEVVGVQGWYEAHVLRTGQVVGDIDLLHEHTSP
jgi:hypothetical protein